MSDEGGGARLQDLLRIMRRLREPGGCSWDRQQSFSSLAPYALEEAYEVVDAIERGDMANLQDELGDLLLQVVFHAQLASEAGLFDFEGIADSICRKLIRRHPHVFIDGAAVAAGQKAHAWEDIKAEERRGGADSGLLSDVPLAMPALARAHKLSKRATRAGFDFEHADQSADKVAEELAEVREAAACAREDARGGAGTHGGASADGGVRIDAGASAEVFEEVGDLLFAAANLARKLEVDAEAALRAANTKFERRFRQMETLASQRGERFEDLDLAAQEELWQAVKRGE